METYIIEHPKLGVLRDKEGDPDGRQEGWRFSWSGKRGDPETCWCFNGYGYAQVVLNRLPERIKRECKIMVERQVKHGRDTWIPTYVEAGVTYHWKNEWEAEDEDDDHLGPFFVQRPDGTRETPLGTGWIPYAHAHRYAREHGGELVEA